MTNTYNTGNALGSTDPRDLLDNASNLDDGMNSALPTFTDRLGVSRDTWAGQQNSFNLAQSGRAAQFDAAQSAQAAEFVASLEASGFVSLGDYAAGLNFTLYNQYMARDGFFYRPAPSSIPFTTTGTWVGGDVDLFNLFSADDVLRQDLADATDPSKGAGMVGRSTVVVESIADLLQARRDVSQAVVVAAYHPGKFALSAPTNALGGGAFKWSPNVPRTDHNGGTTISPTVPWDGVRAGLANFLDGVGETAPAATGCWVRLTDRVNLVDFGATIGHDVDSSASWSAATIYAASNHKTLYLPDGIVRVDSPAVIVGSTTGFSTVHLEGTFATTATRLGYIPSDCGSVIFTNGNSALDIWFNFFANENFCIRGVGFVDSSHYPAGTPNAPVAAVIIRKGTVDGSNARYITGNVLESCAFQGYVAATEYIGVAAGTVPSAALLNYIGPTTYDRVHVGNCRDAVLLTDSSMNHLWVRDSVWFEMTGYGIRLIKTASGSGGNVRATFDNMVFEGMRGPLNAAGGLSGAGVAGAGEYRNKLVLNSCDREFCGNFGPTEGNGFYSGNPLGYVGNTDVIINGVWTSGLAYGEITLPGVETGGTVSSSVPAQFVLTGSRNLTPETVNVAEDTFAVSSGGSVTKSVVAGGVGGFGATLTLTIAGGTLGYQTVLLAGQTAGGKLRTVSGALGYGVTVIYTDGASTSLCDVQIGNVTIYDLDVTIRVTNRSGFAPYIN